MSQGYSGPWRPYYPGPRRRRATKSKTPSKIVVVSGNSRHEVDVRRGQKITIWKLGDPGRGWIPSRKHFDEFVKLLGEATARAVQGEPAHLIFHYGVQTEQIEL